MRFKYIIEMKWVNDGDDDIVISPENIKRLIIDSSYTDKYMDILYSTIVLDKNDIDKIVLKAKTATIHMNIYKVNIDEDTQNKILTTFSGEMVYFINTDINYNKEIDYTGDAKNSKNIQRELSIGLMFKEAIEYNKQTSNTVLSDTTMINAVGLFLKNYPSLIEKFSYNDKLDQLIVPPKDSLVKTIVFLNNVKVFFSTPYRFYIEPGCIYLISSSGLFIPKKGELYHTCLFTVNKLDSPNANIVGMDYDSKNKCYSIQVNVKDTSYNMDNDTCKTLNSLSCIVDPSKSHSLSALDSVNDVISRINTLKETINSTIKESLDIIKGIPSKLTDFKLLYTSMNINVTTYSNNAIAAIDNIIELIKNSEVKSDSNPTGMDDATKKSYISSLTEYKNGILKSLADFNGLTEQYAGSMSKTLGCLGDFTNLSSYLNAITPINMSDNTNILMNTFVSTNKKVDTNISFIDTTLKDRVNDLNAIIAYIKSSENIIGKIDDTKAVYNAQNAILVNSRTKLAEEETKLADSLIDYKAYQNSIKTILDKNLKDKLTTLKTTATKSLKDTFIGIKTDISNIGIAAKKALNDIKNASEHIRDILKSSNLSLNSLKDLQKDITAIKDISNIGMLGISQFKINLGLVKDGTGDTIVRVKNDNANMIKNIVSTIKNSINSFSLNKNDLDFTVFTLNKQYLIKNYYAHADKDGLFLLTRRLVIFVKEDEHFLCNTTLEFDKLADDANAALATKASSTTTISGNTNIMMANVNSILDIVKTGSFDLDSLSKIVTNAESIEEAYKKLKSPNSGTVSNEEMAKIIKMTEIH